MIKQEKLISIIQGVTGLTPNGENPIEEQALFLLAEEIYELKETIKELEDYLKFCRDLYEDNHG